MNERHISEEYASRVSEFLQYAQEHNICERDIFLSLCLMS